MPVALSNGFPLDCLSMSSWTKLPPNLNSYGTRSPQALQVLGAILSQGYPKELAPKLFGSRTQLVYVPSISYFPY